MNAIKKIAVFPLMVLLSFAARSGFAAANGGQNAADYLNINPDAETVSMGGNSAALVSNRPSIGYNNPAALSGIDRVMFSFFEAAYPAGLYYRYAGLGMPALYGNLAVSFGVINYTGVDTYNQDFTKLSVDDSYDAVVSAGYAVTIARTDPVYREFGSLGINVKFLESKLAYYNSEAIAVDIGGIYNVPFAEGLTAGLALKNFGSDMKYVATSYPLPTTIDVGLGYKNAEYENMVAALDYCSPSSGNSYYSLGLSVMPLYFLRLNAGYRQTQDNLFTGFSTGFGLIFGHFRLDYAYMPVNDLSPVNYVTFSVDIGNIVSLKTASDFYLDKHFRDAEALYREGDYIEARRGFEEILSVYPGHDASREYLEKITDKIDKAGESKDRKITKYMEKAQAAIDNKDFILAKRYYNYVVSLSPDNDEARVGLEKLWKSIKDSKLEEEREQHSRELENLWSSARESYRTGDYVEAKGYFNQILAIDPANQGAKNALVEMDSQLIKIEAGQINEIFAKGLALYNEGRFREASNYFDAVILAAPNRTDAKELAAKCQEIVSTQDKEQKAQQLAQDQERAKPELDRAYDKALTYYEKNNFDMALDNFDKSLEIAFKYQFTKYIENINKYEGIIKATLAERHYKAGFEYLHNNNLEAAFSEYKQSLNYNPDNLTARVEMEKINKELGQKYYEKGMSYFSRGEMGKARDAFRKALEYEPDKPEALRALDRIK